MPDMYDDRHRHVSLSLIALAARTSGRLSPYLSQHLSGHVADGRAWRSLAAVPQMLDRLDPDAVTADALRTVFMDQNVPPEVAGVIAGRHRLKGARSKDAAGIRHVATAFTQGFLLGSESPTPDSPWVITWAVTGREQLHVTLPAHVGFVNQICAVSGRGGHTLIASGGDDFLVRIWDPATAAPVGEPFRKHSGTVEAVCAVRLPGDRAGVASAGTDGIICIWDITAGQLFTPPLRGHDGTIRALCELRRPGGGSWVVSAGYDGTIRLWDLETGREDRPALRGHDGPVVALAPSVVRQSDAVLYSASVDGTVRAWTLHHAGSSSAEIARRSSGIRSLCALRRSSHEEIVAFAGYDGQIEIVSPRQPDVIIDRLRGHQGAVWGLTALEQEGEQTRFLSAGDDATVREWSVQLGEQTMLPLSGHIGTVVSSCVVSTGGGARVIASGGSDGTIRLWSPSSGGTAGRLNVAGPLRGICVLPESGAQTLVTVGLAGTVCFWHYEAAILRRPPVQVTDTPVWCVCAVSEGRHRLAVGTNNGQILLLDASGLATGTIDAHDGPIRSLAAVSGARGMVLASVGDDRTLRLWDLRHLEPYAEPLRGHPGAGTVSKVVAIPSAGGIHFLATSADDGSIQSWDPLVRESAGPLMAGHVGPVVCLSVIRPVGDEAGAIVSGGVDATMRLWRLGDSTALLQWDSTHAGGIRDVAVLNESAEGATVASAGADGRVILHRLKRSTSGDPGARTVTWSLTEVAALYHGDGGGMRGLSRIPGKRTDLLAAVDEAGSTLLWDVAERRLLGHALVAASAVQRAVVPVTINGQELCAAIGGDGALRLWDLRSSDPVAVVAGPRWGAMSSLDAIPVDSHTASEVVTGGSDGQLRWWNGRDLGLRHEVTVSGAKPVLDVCCLDATLVSAVLDDGSLEVWDLMANRSVISIVDMAVSAQCRVPSADGPTLLLCGCRDGQVILLDPLTGDILERRLPHGGERVHAVGAVPGLGRTMRCVSAGRDGSICKWQPLSNDPGQLLPGFLGKLQFVTDMRVGGIPVVTAGGYDGNIFFWGADTGALLGSIPLGVPVLSATGAPGSYARMLVGTSKGVMRIDLDKAILDHQPLPGS